MLAQRLAAQRCGRHWIREASAARQALDKGSECCAAARAQRYEKIAGLVVGLCKVHRRSAAVCSSQPAQRAAHCVLGRFGAWQQLVKARDSNLVMDLPLAVISPWP
jgi:hypothetical protein